MAAQKKQDIFTRFTTKTSEMLGRPWIFAAALIIILIWAAAGPLLKFSETWQLVINTGTTIITFLMVFIIQNTQNRNDLAVNIKLDKLLEERGFNSEEVLAAEMFSDRKLEREQREQQKKATQKTKRHKKRN
jgi:low affinity Fe/Cu permease